MTAVDIAIVGGGEGVAEVLSTAAEQQLATPTTNSPQSSVMISFTIAETTASHTTDDEALVSSEITPTQPSASESVTEQSPSHPPPSISPSTPLHSHTPPSTPPPSHTPPSTPIHSYPLIIPSPDTTSASTQQTSNQPTTSGTHSFEVCAPCM